ncbi:spore germination protein GerPE [Ornithinibacillus xuwenensis]|uniref:Spore germination protein GerPE n=1 Tax=Ornithinibacillus xuwenensis TaxID=3144668 RepID=A0ABU9XLG0_9BACI
MQKRLVNVSRIGITSIAFSSMINIGDAVYYTPRSRAIAVQKEGSIFTSDDEKEFQDFPIFRMKPKWLESNIPVHERSFHHNDHIHVGHVSITGVSQSSIAQVGGIQHIDAEARIKHIRILRNEEDNFE